MVLMCASISDTCFLFIQICIFFKLVCSSEENISEITFTVKEHPPENQLVGNLYRKTGITPTVHTVRLHTIPSELMKLFRIERSTGDLYTTKQATSELDREKHCPDNKILHANGVLSNSVDCILSLLVSVNNQLFLKVSIILEDINDHTPTFSTSIGLNNGYVIHINETNNPEETQLPLPRAIDRDSNSALFYYLKPEYLPFRLVHEAPPRFPREALYLQPTRYLDFETEEEFQLNLTVCDARVNQSYDIRCSTQKIHVVVQNANDEKPIFLQKLYKISISARTPINYRLLKVIAIDADKPPFNRITYHILPDHSGNKLPLRIDSNDGSIYLTDLSEATPSVYRFHVLATDRNYSTDQQAFSSQLSVKHTDSIATVTLNIENSQNLPPQISSIRIGENYSVIHLKPDDHGSLQLAITENQAIPQTLAHFTVIDRSGEEHGTTFCHLQENAGLVDTDMRLNQFLSVKQVSRLNRVYVYRLMQHAVLDAEVLFTDKNQTMHDYQRDIQPTRVVKQISASIICYDQKNSSSYSSVTLDIKVLDVDEFDPQVYAFLPSNNTILKPVFTSFDNTVTFNISLFENVSIDTTLFQLKVHDNDSLSLPWFSTSSVSENFSCIHVHPTSGEVSLKYDLDFEASRQCTDLIVLSESNKIKVKIVVEIIVLDVNDNVPYFTEPNASPLPHFLVPFVVKHTQSPVRELRFMHTREEQQHGAFIGQVSAQDADSGHNGKVNYTIIDITAMSYNGDTRRLTEQPQLRITIDENGTLRNSGRLDRETSPQIYALICASDLGSPQLSVFTVVQISLTDINDNKPVWRFPTEKDNLIVVSKFTPIGSTLTRVHAVDKDEATRNGAVTYELNELTGLSASQSRVSKIVRHLLDVNGRTGEITLLYPVESLPDGFIEVFLVASDNGEPKHSTPAKLIFYFATNPQTVEPLKGKEMYLDKPNFLVDQLKDTTFVKPLSLFEVSLESDFWSNSWKKIVFQWPQLMIGIIVCLIVVLSIPLVVFCLWKLRNRRARLKKRSVEWQKASPCEKHSFLASVDNSSYNTCNNYGRISEPADQGTLSDEEKQCNTDSTVDGVADKSIHPCQLDSQAEGNATNLTPVFHYPVVSNTVTPVYLTTTGDMLVNTNSGTNKYIPPATSFVSLPSDNIPLKIVALTPTSSVGVSSISELVTTDYLSLSGNFLAPIVPVCRVTTEGNSLNHGAEMDYSSHSVGVDYGTVLVTCSPMSREWVNSSRNVVTSADVLQYAEEHKDS